MPALLRRLTWPGLLLASFCVVAPASARDFTADLLSNPQTFAQPPFRTDSLLVRFQPAADMARMQSNLARHYGAVSLKVVGAAEHGWFDVRIAANAASRRDAVRNIIDTYRRLEADPTVAKVTFNWTFKADYAPNDPYAVDDGDPSDRNVDQFYLYYMNALDAWDLSKGSSGVTVAVVDSGVAVSHPDLKNIIASGGYDFADNDSNPATDIAGDKGNGDGVDNNGDGYTDVGVSHGTHVAGLIAGIMDNGAGIAGTAGGGTRILPVRVMTDEGAGDLNAIANGLKYAADHGADVINMSLGMPQKLWCIIPIPPDQLGAMSDAVAYAYGKGVAIFAATGNAAENGTSCGVSYPAALDGVFAVGSSNRAGQRSYYSDFGGSYGQVAATALGGDFVKNGEDISVTEWVWSTWVVSKGAADASNGQYQPGQHTYSGALGTSMATPEAAGLGALVLSVDPSLTPDEVYAVMRENAKDIGSAGVDAETGYGQVDFLATLEAAATSTVAVN
ncbi:MAG: S8 family serine peptidase [Candidatus Schekmanbacteria bacterium]|nr:S8 family serine peptidase [Candidatus Schekmanbacteria bacterium]